MNGRELEALFTAAGVSGAASSSSRPKPGPDGATVYSRMVGATGSEDPATGSASGPLGCYLVRHGLVPPSAAGAIVSAQGVKMGRPSRIHIRLAVSGSDITRVQVGGDERARRRRPPAIGVAMIVRPGDGVLHLITQPDHAALARRLMELWPSLAKAERRRDILTAIEHHDRGWRDADAALTVDPASGRIRDFMHVPVSVRQGVWPASVAQLAAAPWAAALVAHHAVTVYDRYRRDPEWQDFFPIDDRSARRAPGAGRRRPESARARLRLPPARRPAVARLLHARGHRRETLGPWTIRLDGARLHVTPNPFVHGRVVRRSRRARSRTCRTRPTRRSRAAIAAGRSRALEGVVAVERAHYGTSTCSGD